MFLHRCDVWQQGTLYGSRYNEGNFPSPSVAKTLFAFVANASRLSWETRLQRWTHGNALPCLSTPSSYLKRAIAHQFSVCNQSRIKYYLRLYYIFIF
ncbi:MAG: hypothetical protein V7L09_29335 [Nostoc sp.]|uniref:hypothetical protein n=1 Tax=Nostoc sp. TaxID=1180 RepID=UPI002FF155C3